VSDFQLYVRSLGGDRIAMAGTVRSNNPRVDDERMYVAGAKVESGRLIMTFETKCIGAIDQCLRVKERPSSTSDFDELLKSKMWMSPADHQDDMSCGFVAMRESFSVHGEPGSRFIFCASWQARGEWRKLIKEKHADGIVHQMWRGREISPGRYSLRDEEMRPLGAKSMTEIMGSPIWESAAGNFKFESTLPISTQREICQMENRYIKGLGGLTSSQKMNDLVKERLEQAGYKENLKKQVLENGGVYLKERLITEEAKSTVSQAAIRSLPSSPGDSL
jgi:hypothetical protein